MKVVNTGNWVASLPADKISGLLNALGAPATRENLAAKMCDSGTPAAGTVLPPLTSASSSTNSTRQTVDVAEVVLATAVYLEQLRANVLVGRGVLRDEVTLVRDG
jgi:hypothetical protein